MIETALVRRLIRNGILSTGDIIQMTDEIEESGSPERAHQLRCLFVKEIAPLELTRQRGKLRLVGGGKQVV